MKLPVAKRFVPDLLALHGDTANLKIRPLHLLFWRDTGPLGMVACGFCQLIQPFIKAVRKASEGLGFFRRFILAGDQNLARGEGFQAVGP